MTFYLDKYKYCPLCSGKLAGHGEYIECSGCGYRIFDNAKPSVNVIIEDKKKGLLLVTRKINPFKGWLDFPGGFSKSGETLEETGIREAKEELGVDVKLGVYIGSYALEYEYSGLVYKLVTAFFAAKADISKIHVGDDVSKFEFIPRDKVLKRRLCYPHVNKSAVKDYFCIFPAGPAKSL